MHLNSCLNVLVIDIYDKYTHLSSGCKTAVQILLVHPILKIADPETSDPVICAGLSLSCKRGSILLRLQRRIRCRRWLLIVVLRRLLWRRHMVLWLLRLHPLLQRLLWRLHLVLRWWNRVRRWLHHCRNTVYCVWKLVGWKWNPRRDLVDDETEHF